MEAKPLPTQAVVGKISTAGPFEPSKGSDGTYLTGALAFDAYDAGTSQKIYFTFRPEWFTEAFHEEVYTDFGGSVADYLESTYAGQTYTKKDGSVKSAATSFSYVYEMNIACGDAKKPSLLQCLFPTDELFNGFVERSFKAQIDPAEPDLAAINAFLSEEFVGKKMGYMMSQKRIKTDRLDDNNKSVYMLDSTREAKSYFPVTAEKISALEKAAKSSKRGFALTFNADSVLDYFFSR